MWTVPENNGASCRPVTKGCDMIGSGVRIRIRIHFVVPDLEPLHPSFFAFLSARQ